MSLQATLRRLPPAAVDFARSLTDHHWFEASWLYERRATVHAQGALLSADDWLELEQRTLAHVLALSKGGTLVLDECEDKAIDGDRGELHTAVRLLCRADHPQRFDDLVDRLDWHEPDRAWAVIDALAWDAPDSWQDPIAALLGDESLPDEAVGPLARLVGLRGWPLLDSVLGVLEDRVGDLEAISWTLGALGVGESLPELYDVIQEDRPADVRRAAAIAALRAAPGEVLSFLAQVVGSEAWAAVPLALGGGPSSWPTLSESVRACPSAEGLIALGLFGYVGAIEPLLDLVEDEQLGEAAAEGLYVLTGAELHQESYEEDPDAEVSADEDEDPPGLLVCRLPRSRSVWTHWLDEHSAALDRTLGTRIRGGEAFEPGRALERIGRTGASPQVRDWMLDELDIRHRLRVRAWSRMLEKTRRDALGAGRIEVDARPKIVTGEWYVAGQPVRRTS